MEFLEIKIIKKFYLICLSLREQRPKVVKRKYYRMRLLLLVVKRVLAYSVFKFESNVCNFDSLVYSNNLCIAV